MGQVEASPHGGCCQDSVYACAQVHVALEGQGLPARFLTLPRHRRASEPRIRALAFVYKQPPGRALRESAVVLTWLQEAWMYFADVFVRGRLWGWPQCDILEVRAAHLCWCTVSAGVLPGVPCISGGVLGIKVSSQSREASSPGQVGGGGSVVSLSRGRRSWNMDFQVWPLPRSFHPLGLSLLARSSALHPRLGLLSLSPDKLQVCRPVAEVAQSVFDLARLQLVGGRVLLGEPDVIKCKSLGSDQGICSSGPD